MPKEEGYKGSEPDTSTRQVAELLTSILNEVRQKVARGVPEPTTEAVQGALREFQEINAALLLKPGSVQVSK
jgi:hypothetical protein